MNFSAVILAGGKSSRMGRDKAFLEIGGQPLLERQIQLARKAGAAEVFISGRPGVDYSPFGCRVLVDRFIDAGPLAGIERALDAGPSHLLLALAVDLPDMNAQLLCELASQCSENFGAIPCLNGSVEPLAAFYPKAALNLAVSLLQKNTNGVKNFAEQCVKMRLATFATLPGQSAGFFFNWNSPDNL